jgi:hypothetical protein
MALKEAAKSAKALQDKMNVMEGRANWARHAEAAEGAVYEVLGLHGKCIRASKIAPRNEKLTRDGWGHDAVVLVTDEEDDLKIEFLVINSNYDYDRYRTTFEDPQVSLELLSINDKKPPVSDVRYKVKSLAELGRLIEHFDSHPSRWRDLR